MLVGEQFALVVNDVDDYIESAKGMFGHSEWVRDEVKAITLFDRYEKVLGDHFPSLSYHIAFNYDLIPQKEFEIIRPVYGKSPHNALRSGSFGHVGYHLKEGETFEEHLDKLIEKRGRVTYVCTTVKHSTSPRFYKYAYVQFENIPFVVKVIERLEECYTIAKADMYRDLYYQRYGHV